MWRHDRIRAVTVRELDGVLDTVSLAPGVVQVEITTQDLAALETLVPRRLTSTTLFGATCPDVGAPMPAVLGTVDNLPLLYVTDDLPDSIFKYLVGEGTLSVTTVRRNRIGETQLEDLHASEWSASAEVLPDGSTVTIVRTPTRQSATGGGFHQLYADVSGPASERNPAVAVARVLNDPVWGGGLAVDVENITSQAALIPAVVRLDGALGALRQQVRLRDVLAQLLMVCGGRAQYDAFRGWQVVFDAAAATSARMVLRDDAGPGEKTLLRIGRRVSPPLRERVQTLQLQYAPDYVHDGAYRYTAADRAVGTTGRLKSLGADGPGDFIRDQSAADWIAGYLATRELFLQDRVEDAETTEEGRKIQIGDIVHVVCPQLQIAGEDRRVVAVTKGSGRQRLTHERYDPALLYSPSAGALPTVRFVSSVAGVPVSDAILAPGSVETEALATNAVTQFAAASDLTVVGVSTTPIAAVELVVTTVGGVVEVSASLYIDATTRLGIGSLTAQVKNVTLGTAGFGDVWVVDSTSLRQWTLAPVLIEQPPAGTYLYRVEITAGVATTPLWQKTVASIIAREFRR